MNPTLLTDEFWCSTHEARINVAQQSQNLNCLVKTREINIIKGNTILKLRKRKSVSVMQPIHPPHYSKFCRHFVTTASTISMLTNSIVTTYPYQQNYNYPIAMNDWSHLHTPLFTVHPIPVIIPTPSPIFSTHITPLVGAVVQPMLSPTIVQEHVTNMVNYTNEYNYSTEQVEVGEEASNDQLYYIPEEVIVQKDIGSLNTDSANTSTEPVSFEAPIEAYLKLPKELFPTPNMLALDPNPVIDEFCKMPNIYQHMPWLLDLEFGIPKAPITRPIPTYNVKFNSINCKNAPDAIHPGFESCDPDFKKVILFYYDCVVSAWYKGFMIMHCDRSVENFESWLRPPMQVLGMCWP